MAKQPNLSSDDIPFKETKMLISLLLNGQGELIAAGPACDQHAAGASYWSEVLGLSNEVIDGTETAVVEIKDRQLADEILSFHVERNQASSSRIMEALNKPLQQKRTIVRSRFAA